MTYSYEADDLMQEIVTGWTLTGDFGKDGVPGSGPFPVQFFAHDQVEPAEYEKAVMVTQDLGPLVNEFKGEFFLRQEQNFQIKIRLKMEGLAKDSWDYTEDGIQQMQNMVLTILDTVYNPYTAIGPYWESDRIWSNQDDLKSETPTLVRVLTLKLSKIIPRSPNTFVTFQRGVLIDGPNSNPTFGGTYQYTEIFDVQNREGYGVRQIYPTSHEDGQGLPLNYRGKFDGSWIASSYLKGTDLGVSPQFINQLYVLVSNGEQRECAFVQTYINAAGKTLTKTSIVIVTDVSDSYPKTEQAVVTFTGKIIKPGTWSVSP
jgi:hypothetical protein